MDNNYRRQASSYGLPISVIIIIPFFIILLTNDTTLGWDIDPLLNMLIMIIGLATILSGLALLAVTIRMFSKIGEGTLAPWAPPQKLVIKGIYQRTRSPMILGVLIALLGEAIILSSFWIFIWFIIATITNHLYFIRFEEPGLLDRFGDAYASYKENVPRWIPRRYPWKPDQESKEI